MKQFGPRETHQRSTRSWAFEFAGPGFDVQHLVTRREVGGGCPGVCDEGARARAGADAPPLGNTGGTVVIGAQR